MKTKRRKALFLTIKVALAVALLVWVFGRVHWNDYVKAAGSGETYSVLETRTSPDGRRQVLVRKGMLWWRARELRPRTDFEPVSQKGDEIVRPGLTTTIRNIDQVLLPIAASGFVLSLLTIAVRWWYLLRIQEIRIRLWEAVRLTFLGQFFNTVVPGTVGGDLVKAYYVAQHTPRKAGVLICVFVDRVLGLAELTLMAAVMVAAVLGAGLMSFAELRAAVVTVVVVLGIVVATATFLLSGRVRRALHLQRLYQRSRIAHHMAAAGEAARIYGRNLPALGLSLLITLVAHIFFIGAIALLGKALALQTPWYTYFVYVPLIYIIGAIPITPGGVGVVEGAYRSFFCPPVPVPQVLALALLARLLPIFWGLPGILVAVTGPKLPKAEQIEAELAAGGDGAA